MFKKNMSFVMALLCCAVMSIHTNVKADETYSSLYEAIKAETATSYTMSADETATQNYGAMNASNLTITGNGHSVSGNNNYSGITIGSGKTLTINNIGSVTDGENPTYSGFQNFRANDGAVINNVGTVNIINTVISNNNAYLSSGSQNTETHGVVYNAGGGTLSIAGGTFYNNNAKYGGALYNAGHITNLGTADNMVTFKNNHGWRGGALFNEKNNTSTGNIDNIYAIFDSNSANFSNQNPRWGGAIQNKGNIGTIGRGSQFINNRSLHLGGAINNISGAVITTIEVTTFSGNYAGTQGGAINNSGTIATIDAGTQFSGNTSPIGGAINNASGGSIESIFANFDGNSATTRGGAINNEGSIRYIEINSVFTSNTAGEGAAISNYGGTITNLGGNYENNTANTAGGAIFNSGTITNMRGGNYLTNSATTNGGAIYNRGTVSVIENTPFIGNYAQFGGAIYNNPSGTIERIKRSAFEENRATGSNGGAAIFNEGTITTIDSYFRNNSANGNGGAINNISGTITTISDAEFTNNSSATQGGAINNVKSTASGARDAVISSIERTTFSNNSASTQGGAIWNSGTTSIIANEKDVLFKDNYAGGTFTAITNEESVVTGYSHSGGELNDIYNEGTITLQAKAGRTITFNGTITDNETPAGTLNIGGADYTGDVIFNNTVTQNTVNLNNGATVKLGTNTEQGSHGTLNMSAFSNDANGGTIDMRDGATNNSVDFGSTVTLNSDLKINADLDLANKVMDTITSTTDATIADNGHHIILNEITVVADPTEKLPFTVNFAQGKVKDYVTLTGTSVAITGANPNNSYITTYSTADGNLKFEYGNLYTAVTLQGDGRVYTMDKDEGALPDGITGYGTLAPTDLTINGGGYTVNGGGKEGITVDTGKTLTTNNVKIDGFNTALKTTDNGKLSVTNTTFTNNGTTANSDGGAIYANGTNSIITIEGSTFNGNYSTHDGGAVFNQNGTVNITNTTFTGNYSTHEGGAIQNEGSVTISDVQFTNNKSSFGGAIYNDGTLENIGSADNNITFSENKAFRGGALFNESNRTINNIYAEFDSNTATEANPQPNIRQDNWGGAIVNKGTITTIANESVFKNNRSTDGGAIYNNGGTIGTMGGTYQSNSANIGGVLYNARINQNVGSIGTLTGTYNNNSATINGGVIYNGASINKIENATFTNNSAHFAGAVYNNPNGTINEITNTAFKGNIANATADHPTAGGGAIFNEGIISKVSGTFDNNVAHGRDSINGNGGAISNYTDSASRTQAQILALSGTFTNNIARDNGGAIYNGANATVSIIADTDNVLFQNNYANAGYTATTENGVTTYTHTGGNLNDIYNAGTVNLQANEGKTITFNGTVNGSNGTINVNGGNTVFNNAVTDNSLALNNGSTVKLGTNAEQNTKGTMALTGFSNDTNGGIIDMRDGATNNSVDFGSTVTLNSDLKINADLDLANKVMDTITSTTDATVADNGHHIILNEITIVADPTEKLPFTVNFAQGKVKDYVTLTGTSVSITGANPNNSYITTYSTADGNLKFEYGNLYTAVHTAGDERVYTMKADEPALPDGITGYGNMESTSLTVNGNGYSINGGGKTGIVIQTGQALTLSNIGSVTKNGENYTVNGSVNGFQNTADRTGAILNDGTLNVDNVVFSNNTSSDYSYGGAIYNRAYGTINSIKGTFINNSATSDNTNIAHGGAVFNGGNITSINSDFVNNYTSTNASQSSGGAIFNSSIIGTIGSVDNKAQFIGNYSTTKSTTDIAHSFAGAISNQRKITNIYADFTKNYTSSASGQANGGAICNSNIINGIGSANNKAIFNGNYANGSAGGFGGAIVNQSTITDIYADFTNNHTASSNGHAQGGAIRNGNNNNSIIENLVGNFSNNYASGTNGALGGAIANFDTIKYISGDFTGNYAFTTSGEGTGGAIRNRLATSTITAITDSNFTGNAASTAGGAIYNSGTVGIVADTKNVEFKDNYAGGTFTKNADGTYSHNGGDLNDIYNAGTVNLQAKEGKTITFNGTVNGSNGTINVNGGNTVFNNAVTDNSLALNNGSTVKLGNNAEQNTKGTMSLTGFSNDANGGIIDMQDGATNNSVDFGSNVTLNSDLKINADLDLANKVMDTIMSTDDATVADNGHHIILNEITVVADPTEKLPFTVNFAQGKVKDYVTLTGTSVTITGANPNNSYITTYTTADGNLNFEYGNLYTAVNTQGDGRVYTMTEDEAELPDSISNYGTMASKDLSISGNNHSIKGGGKEGIAVDNGKTLSANDVKFDGFSTALTTTEGGKLILRNTTFSNNNNDVINNGTTDLQGEVTLNNITGDNGTLNVTGGSNTVANTLTQKDVTVSSGASLVNNGTATISNLTNNNKINGTGTLTVTGNTTNNGYIFQDKITNTGTFNTNIDNVIATSGITNNGTLNLTGNVIFDTTIPKISGTGTTNINSDIKNKTDITQGNIRVANDKTFTNDRSVTSSLTNNGTFYNREGKTATINLLNNSNRIENNGTMSVVGGTNTGNIHGTGTLEIKAGENLDNTGIIAQQEITNNGSVSTDSTKFFAESGTITNNGTLTYNAGQNTVNDITGSEIGNVILNTNGDFFINNKISGTQWSLNSGTLYFGDNSDVASAAAFNANGGTINVMNGKIGDRDLGNVNLNGKTNLAMDFRLNDLSTDKFNANITNNGGKFNVSALNVTGTTLKDHFRVYLGDTTTLGRDNVSSDTFNLPSIMTPIRRISGRVQDGYVMYAPSGNSWKDYNPSVLAAPVAAQLGGYLTMLNAYEEGFRNLDMKMLMTQSERQALKMANKYASTETPQVFSPTYLPEKESAGWFRPYATFERVGLSHGPKVSNILYGSFFGGDSPMYELKNGWDFQWSLYAGYTGSHQAFQGNDIYQNGGILGATGVWYKGNFFTALTANVGASVAEASTMFGSEDFPMLMAGVASKTGYNFEFFRGKFIFQPYYMMSYTFVNTFNYHNGAGVRMTSDPLHAINIAPGIKLIGNLKNGWQPYFNIQMVWNAIDETKFKAANISLPEMSIKPYVQYGVGLQRRWGERFTGYIQAMIRNGGRNGVALSFGFRWAVGKNYSKNPFKGKSKVIKQ